MTAVSSSTIVHDIITKLASFLQSNVTDPISGSRTDSNWVLPSWPDEEVQYPIICVNQVGGSDEWISVGTSYKKVTTTVQIDVFSKSTKERDEVWDDVYNQLRTNFKTTLAGSYHLVNMNMVTCFNQDAKAPKSRGNVHRKIARFNFVYFAT